MLYQSNIHQRKDVPKQCRYNIALELSSANFKMKWTIAVLLCFCAVVAGIFQSPEPRGIQLRITQKGLDYSEYDVVYFGHDFARYCIQAS